MESANARTIRRLYELFNQLDIDPVARRGSEVERNALDGESAREALEQG